MINKTQKDRIDKLLIQLRHHADAVAQKIPASPIKRGSLMSFIVNNYVSNGHVSYQAPLGGGSEVMLYNNAIINAATILRIRTAIDALFGPNFYETAVNGEYDARGTISVLHDIVPAIEQYLNSYTRQEERKQLVIELNQLRTLLQVAKSSTITTRVKNQLSAPLIKRWENLERVIIADIAEIDAFS